MSLQRGRVVGVGGGGITVPPARDHWQPREGLVGHVMTSFRAGRGLAKGGREGRGQLWTRAKQSCVPEGRGGCATLGRGEGVKRGGGALCR